MKRCTKCGSEYEATPEFFERDPRKEGGIGSRCKPCMSRKALDWKARNPEAVAVARERGAKANRARREQDREARMRPVREWLDAHAELVADLEWWDEECRRNAEAQRLARLRPEAAEYARINGVCLMTARYHTLADARAKFITMKEIRRGLKGRRQRKANAVWDALPYDADELFDHLQALLRPGMTWDNFGSYWCLDHIVPYCTFGVATIGDDAWKAAFALTNLQPLTLEENAAKGVR